jgi:hypothetical protein
MFIAGIPFNHNSRRNFLQSFNKVLVVPLRLRACFDSGGNIFVVEWAQFARVSKR